MAHNRMWMIAAVLALALAAIPVFGQGTGLGVQLASDTSVSLVYRAQLLEAGVSLRVYQEDTGEDAPTADMIYPGAHAALLLGRIGLGATVRTAVSTGDVDYAEYIDAGIRVSFDQFIGERFYISGLLYPVWIQTRELDMEDAPWTLEAAFGYAGLAATFLF